MLNQENYNVHASHETGHVEWGQTRLEINKENKIISQDSFKFQLNFKKDSRQDINSKTKLTSVSKKNR